MPPYQTQFKFRQYEPDFSTTLEMIHEYATDIQPNHITRFPLLKYRRYTTPVDNLTDDLHEEVMPGRRTYQDYNLFAYVSAEPKRQELSKFGIDEPRNLMVYLAITVLEEAGLAVQLQAEYPEGTTDQDDLVEDPDSKDGGRIRFLVGLGDRFWFQRQEYVILSTHEDQFFGNTAVPTYMVASANLVREDTSKEKFQHDANDDWRREV